MARAEEQFVFGVDLDGVVADFYGRMREIAAEWLGVNIETLPREVSFGLPEWGLLPDPDEYPRLHRFAVTQHGLFETMVPIEGAPQALRRLSNEGIRIRIITHRLFIRYFHHKAVAQTTTWHERYGVPYWDLCFMSDKGAVGADLYIEDTPNNIEALRREDKPVIVFSNSTNRDVLDEPGGRAGDWRQAEQMVRDRYYQWLDEHSLERPAGPGLKPSWTD